MTSLAAVPALRHLPPDALAALDAAARPVRYAAGDVVRPAGTPADAAVLLLGGAVVATWTGADGHEVWLERWDGPAIADKPAVLGDGVPRTGLVAATAVTARLLPRHRFLRLLTDEPVVREHVLRRLAADVTAGRDRLAHAVALPATARVAAHLSTTLGWRGSQEDLARLLGLSRVTVNRALSRLTRAGAVRTTPQGITVTNQAALNSAANGESTPR